MSESDLKNISRKAISGALSLTFRRMALQAISFVTINIILARILPVSTLGVFNIGAAVIAFFAFFADIGLAAAIIQKKGQVTREDLKTTFTIQQILVLTLTLIIFFSAQYISSIYGLGEKGIFLIRALALSFFITSLKVIPAVLLERDLRFNPLVSVEIFETLVFNVLLIVFSLANFDLDAFSFASVARSTSGAFLIYLVAPWRIGLGISKQAAKSLLSFGIPFQANALLALLKDRLVPLVVAKIIGATGIGLVTWAQNLAFLPLEVMNIIIRVSFPTLSRLQGEKANLKLVLEKSLFATTLFVYPMLFGILALAPSLVTHVVSNKWEPALPSLYLFSLSAFWATLSTTFTNALNAIGQIKTTLKLMILWTSLTWILTPLLTLMYGYIGVGIASAIISFTSIVTIILVKRYIDVAIWENIWQPFLASFLMAMVVFLVSTVFVRDALTVFLMTILGGAVYFGLLFILAKEKMKKSFEGVKNAFLGS